VAGALITIEGIDGTGKTTLARGLQARLRHRGIAVTLLREPGGAPVSEAIRRLVKDPALSIGARTEALLYAAARAELVQVVLGPLLARDQWVLLDRFVDSSLAYQGAGRRLGVEQVRALNLFATGGLTPDRTLLLSLSPQAARQRAHGREPTLDRLEREDRGFFERVQAGYLELASADPERIRVIDASVRPERVLEQAVTALADLLWAASST
jgi:dTMP kinase